MHQGFAATRDRHRPRSHRGEDIKYLLDLRQGQLPRPVPLRTRAECALDITPIGRIELEVQRANLAADYRGAVLEELGRHRTCRAK